MLICRFLRGLGVNMQVLEGIGMVFGKGTGRCVYLNAVATFIRKTSITFEYIEDQEWHWQFEGLTGLLKHEIAFEWMDGLCFYSFFFLNKISVILGTA